MAGLPIFRVRFRPPTVHPLHTGRISGEIPGNRSAQQGRAPPRPPAAVPSGPAVSRPPPGQVLGMSRCCRRTAASRAEAPVSRTRITVRASAGVPLPLSGHGRALVGPAASAVPGWRAVSPKEADRRGACRSGHPRGGPSARRRTAPCRRGDRGAAASAGYDPAAGRGTRVPPRPHAPSRWITAPGLYPHSGEQQRRRLGRSFFRVLYTEEDKIAGHEPDKPFAAPRRSWSAHRARTHRPTGTTAAPPSEAKKPPPREERRLCSAQPVEVLPDGPGVSPRTRVPASPPWWSYGDSNPRPPPCHGGALPTAP